MHDIIAIPLVVGETGILCAAGFALFRRWEYTLAESAAYAIITTLMLLSFLFQAAFLMGNPGLSPGIETLLSLLAVTTLVLLRDHIFMGWQVARNFISAFPIPGKILFVGWCVLMFQAVLLSPGESHLSSLNPVLLFQQHGRFFVPVTDEPVSALFPVNAIILPHLVLRLNAHAGICFFGFLAYLSIGFSTYALARRYSWPPTAFTVAMVVVSMPRLVYLSASPGGEIIPAATAVFCLLGINRVVEQPNIRDFLLLILGILFGISGDEISLIFPCILVILSCVLLIRRHGTGTWLAIMVRNPGATIAALFPALVFSQCWLFLHNMLYADRWIGSATSFPRNPDGIQGALANLARYILESAHFTWPADRLLNWMMGFSLTGTLQRIYDMLVFPFLGNNGATIPFAIQWVPGASLSWFGPFAFLLVLPALFYAMMRGHRRLKAIAIALIGYVYIVTLILAWTPENARFFSVFYACGGFCIAFLLPPWRFTRTGKRILQVTSAILLFYACICKLLGP